ncbi:MAG: NADH-quinone oxidoreductase subunit C [Hydrogenibacillus sp.]|nr:NADH-quinone oxidoreductase subunit C [Hydrogenibacillus sp.]
MADEQFMTRLVAALRQAFGETVVLEAQVNPSMYGAPLLYVQTERIADVARYLRDEPSLRLDFLNDLHGIDFPDRMEVFYFLQSHQHGHFVALKVRVDRENPHVPTITGIYPAADWQERETYDHFGIIFDGHPNLRRILLPDDWVGHPLRKDYVPHDEGV